MSPDYRKMGLRGERLWGEMVEQRPDDTATLRIFSKPASPLHSYSQGELVECELDDRGLWVPVDEPGRGLH